MSFPPAEPLPSEGQKERPKKPKGAGEGTFIAWINDLEFTKLNQFDTSQPPRQALCKWTHVKVNIVVSRWAWIPSARLTAIKQLRCNELHALNLFFME